MNCLMVWNFFLPNYTYISRFLLAYRNFVTLKIYLSLSRMKVEMKCTIIADFLTWFGKTVKFLEIFWFLYQREQPNRCKSAGYSFKIFIARCSLSSSFVAVFVWIDYKYANGLLWIIHFSVLNNLLKSLQFFFDGILNFNEFLSG